jgi:hypothetical protein
MSSIFYGRFSIMPFGSTRHIGSRSVDATSQTALTLALRILQKASDPDTHIPVIALFFEPKLGIGSQSFSEITHETYEHRMELGDQEQDGL